MRPQNFDMRWIFVIVVVVLLLMTSRTLLHGPLAVVLALISGCYLCNVGWEQLRGSAAPLRSTKTTYWRGQRVEIKQPRSLSRPPWYLLLPGIYYLIFGAALLLLTITSFTSLRF